VHETQTPFSGALHVSDRAFTVALGFMHRSPTPTDAD